MAYVTYEQAIKCKQCGKLRTSIDRFQRTILCQGCGAHIMTYNGNLEAEVTKNADIVTVKVTNKLFSRILEEV
jgi:ribosomal protein S27E